MSAILTVISLDALVSIVATSQSPQGPTVAESLPSTTGLADNVSTFSPSSSLTTTTVQQSTQVDATDAKTTLLSLGTTVPRHGSHGDVQSSPTASLPSTLQHGSSEATISWSQTTPPSSISSPRTLRTTISTGAETTSLPTMPVQDRPGGQLNGAGIAGTVIGVLSAIILACLGVIWWRNRTREMERTRAQPVAFTPIPNTIQRNLIKRLRGGNREHPSDGDGCTRRPAAPAAQIDASKLVSHHSENMEEERRRVAEMQDQLNELRRQVASMMPPAYDAVDN